MKRFLLAQAPFTQLNAPYPAIFYLAAFLRSRGHAATAADLAIDTAREIFSGPGLRKIFAALSEKYPDAESLLPLPEAERSQIIRYLSNASAYIETVDSVREFLAGQKPDFAHVLACPERLPSGFRVGQYLDTCEGGVSAETVASLYLTDLADLITFALDPDFSLVHYAQTKTSSQPRFAEVEASLKSSYIIKEFVRPLARAHLERAMAESGRPDFVCVSVPFPGTLVPALAILDEAHRLGLKTALGGGYVSTELRSIRPSAFFNYVDFLCFDGGFGALRSLAETDTEAGKEPLFNVIRRAPDGRLRVEGFSPAERGDYADEATWDFLTHPRYAELEQEEGLALRDTAPDYAGADFRKYLRFADSDNPMHALWSNGKWLKARLAYGCYWARCVFCDTKLDYIRRFRPSRAKSLYQSLLAQARAAGADGIHLVDEAAPVPQLIEFALENARAGRPLSFWGNTRFEPAFTQDRAEFLSWAGLLAVSAGIEVATESGLARSGKGLALADIVHSMSNLANAGILTHAYLMYGFPGQEAQEIVDSLEVLRQLFDQGLLVSAFWHPLVITRHSSLFAQGHAGPEGAAPSKGDFGQNDIDHIGERAFAAYSSGLESALAAYMRGEGYDRKAVSWFDVSVPSPKANKYLVKNLLPKAERRASASARDRAAWIGGRVLEDGGKAIWSYRNELQSIELPPAAIKRLAELLNAAKPEGDALPAALSFESELWDILGGGAIKLAALRNGGLLYI